MIFVSIQKLKKHVEKKEHERLRKQNEAKKEKVSTLIILEISEHWDDVFKRSDCQSICIFIREQNVTPIKNKMDINQISRVQTYLSSFKVNVSSVS